MPPRWRLSDFLIEEEIFRTHNGAVFKARFRSERKKQCVLKERKAPELGKDRDIANEVSLLERLDHPNIVKCYGHFRDDKKRSLYIVLEYCEHGDLHRLIERRKARGRYFREQDVWRMFLQICAGVEQMHRHSIVHRDLKTLNIFVARDGTVKVGDLGVGRLVGPDTQLLNTFYGTPLYASPELCSNKPYNEKTDIWALGVILYELAALKNPFHRCNSLVELADAIRGGMASVPQLPRHCSPTLARAVRAMLQLDPARRPAVSDILSCFSAPAPAPAPTPATEAEAEPGAKPKAETETEGKKQPKITAGDGKSPGKDGQSKRKVSPDEQARADASAQADASDGDRKLEKSRRPQASEQNDKQAQKKGRECSKSAIAGALAEDQDVRSSSSRAAEDLDSCSAPTEACAHGSKELGSHANERDRRWAARAKRFEARRARARAGRSPLQDAAEETPGEPSIADATAGGADQGIARLPRAPSSREPAAGVLLSPRVKHASNVHIRRGGRGRGGHPRVRPFTAVSCGRRAAAVREWQPEDHDGPGGDCHAHDNMAREGRRRERGEFEQQLERRRLLLQARDRERVQQQQLRDIKQKRRQQDQQDRSEHEPRATNGQGQSVSEARKPVSGFAALYREAAAPAPARASAAAAEPAAEPARAATAGVPRSPRVKHARDESDMPQVLQAGEDTKHPKPLKQPQRPRCAPAARPASRGFDAWGDAPELEHTPQEAEAVAESAAAGVSASAAANEASAKGGGQRLGASKVIAAFDKLNQWDRQYNDSCQRDRAGGGDDGRRLPGMRDPAAVRSPARGLHTRRAIARIHHDGAAAAQQFPAAGPFGQQDPALHTLPLRRKKYNIISGQYD